MTKLNARNSIELANIKKLYNKALYGSALKVANESGIDAAIETVLQYSMPSHRDEAIARIKYGSVALQPSAAEPKERAPYVRPAGSLEAQRAIAAETAEIVIVQPMSIAEKEALVNLCYWRVAQEGDKTESGIILNFINRYDAKRLMKLGYAEQVESGYVKPTDAGMAMLDIIEHRTAAPPATPKAGDVPDALKPGAYKWMTTEQLIDARADIRENAEAWGLSSDEFTARMSAITQAIEVNKLRLTLERAECYLDRQLDEVSRQSYDRLWAAHKAKIAAEATAGSGA